MPATALVRTRSLESRMPGNWHVLFGKGPTEKARATGTSPAAYFTREGADGKGPRSGVPRRRPTSLWRRARDDDAPRPATSIRLWPSLMKLGSNPALGLAR